MAPRMLLQYQVGRTLGTGMIGKVKLGLDTRTNTPVALKLMDWNDVHAPKHLENIAREIRAMQSVTHHNVLRLLEHHEQVTYETSSGELKTMILLVLELAPHGELMDFLLHAGALPERLARTYFHQLIAAMSACHEHGVFHRDLKPENLLLDESFSLKLADFGLAALSETENAAPMELHTCCGTLSYMSPEVVRKVPYEGAPADIWAIGVVLFILLSGAPPFGVADDSDWWFRACALRKHDLFWASHEQTAQFPEGAKDLLTRIFAVEPSERLTLAEIQAHPWFQGETMSAAEVQEAMQTRQAMVERSKAKLHISEQ